MNAAEGMMVGIIGTGVQFDKVVTEGELTIYISIPEKSEDMDISTEQFAINIKKVLKVALQNPNLRVFSKVRKGEYFTKEMGRKAAEQFIEDKYRFKMWGLI